MLISMLGILILLTVGGLLQGSELSIVWKNAILTQGTEVINHYMDNVEMLFDNPQENSLSLKTSLLFRLSVFKKKMIKAN